MFDAAATPVRSRSLVPAAGLLALTCVRLVVAASAPLSADEAYYWVWSRALAPGYLDHPPMVALWIRIGTAIAGDTGLGVRLLAPVSAALGSVLLANAANRLFPGERPGIAAAAVLNATLMLGVGAVTMTPDTPLIFFLAVAFWALVRAQESPRWWLVVGLALGLAMDSKYTAVLFAVGVPAWILCVRRLRSTLGQPWVWAGASVTFALLLPVVAWNADHDWASFLKQGGRTGDWHPDAAARYLSELAGSQFALATPGIFVLFAVGTSVAIRRALRREPAWSLLACVSVPALLVFVQHAVGDRVQGNWPAVVYPPLAVAGVVAARRWWPPAAMLGLIMTGFVYLQAAAAPIPLPRRLDPTLIRLSGWESLAQDADRLRVEADADYLAAEDYGLASLIAWWAPRGTTAVGAEARWGLFDLPRATPGPGLLVVSERRREPPNPSLWAEAVPAGRIVRQRAGVEAEAFRVYRVRMREGADAARLPRPGGQ